MRRRISESIVSAGRGKKIETKKGQPASEELSFSLGSGEKEKPRHFKLENPTSPLSIADARKILALQPKEGNKYVTNTKPGIWIFCRPEDVKVILSNCAEYGHPIPPKLIKSISNNLQAVFLPQGGFVTFPHYGSIQFWQRQGIAYDTTRGVGERERGNLGLFSVGVSRIVRVAGKSAVADEVWQNPRYLTDGQPNPKFEEGDDIEALGTA